MISTLTAVPSASPARDRRRALDESRSWALLARTRTRDTRHSLGRGRGAPTVFDLFHGPPARRRAEDQQRSKEIACVAPADTEGLQMYPSIRMRLAHYLEHRASPYIG